MSFGKTSLRSLSEAAKETARTGGRLVVLTWTHVTPAEAAMASAIASKFAASELVAMLQRPSMRMKLKEGEEGAWRLVVVVFGEGGGKEGGGATDCIAWCARSFHNARVFLALSGCCVQVQAPPATARPD
jgi:hypothetical protein